MGTQVRQHQRTAVNAAVTELAAMDRASVVMPCGTGKTLVGIETARELQPRITVLLAPTLALIGQTLDAWRTEMPIPGARFVAACSDESVAEGQRFEDDISPRELGVTVTTSAMELGGMLMELASEPIVIMTTYSSAPVVGQALLAAGQRANLALFDEAHRTATGQPSQFSSTLFDSTFPADKRLFMTATPRVYPESESGPSISMDNQDLYGRLAHVLPVREAIQQGLIVDYRVLVSVVTTDELEDAAVDPASRYRQAAAVAISKAMDQFKLRKGFLFHRTVSDAADFAGSPFLSREAGLSALHINGAMRMSERLQLLEDFKFAERGLVTNAKCLTEGVDVPAVDLVCFMAPKRSTVDVVQAVGRAMRTAPGKEFGYVLLPVLVDLHNGESLEQAAERSEMSELFHVLSELRDMEIPFARGNQVSVASDDAVQKSLDYVREKVVTVGPPELAEALRKTIRVMTVKDLRSEWDEKFLALKRFKESRGHLKLDNGSEESRALGKFISNCRQLQLRGALSQRNTHLLDSIGFPWSVEDARWEKRFVEATTKPRSQWGAKNYEWLAEQKKSIADGTMPNHRLVRIQSCDSDLFEPHHVNQAVIQPPVSSASSTDRPVRAVSPRTSALQGERLQSRSALFNWLHRSAERSSFRARSSSAMAGMKAASIMMSIDLFLLAGEWRRYGLGQAPGATIQEKSESHAAFEAMREHWANVEGFLDVLRKAIETGGIDDDESFVALDHLGLTREDLAREPRDFMLAASTKTLARMNDEVIRNGVCVALAGSREPEDFAVWLFSDSLRRLVEYNDIASRVLGEQSWRPAKLLEELGVEIHAASGRTEWTRLDSIKALPIELQGTVLDKPGPPPVSHRQKIDRAADAMASANRGPSVNSLVAKLEAAHAARSAPRSSSKSRMKP